MVTNNNVSSLTSFPQTPPVLHLIYNDCNSRLMSFKALEKETLRTSAENIKKKAKEIKNDG